MFFAIILRTLTFISVAKYFVIHFPHPKLHIPIRTPNTVEKVIAKFSSYDGNGQNCKNHIKKILNNGNTSGYPQSQECPKVNIYLCIDRRYTVTAPIF